MLEQDILNEVDSTSAKTNSQYNEEQKEQQELWLKLCANKDPNDSTVHPDAFTEKDLLQAQDPLQHAHNHNSEQ